MYEIFVEQFFEAAHFLRGYQGKCENIHGHRYSVVVRLRCAVINGIGLAYDFTDLKKHLKAVLNAYDHALLNDLAPFNKINPSAENIAAEIFSQLKNLITEESAVLSSVEVRENPHQGVVYTP